MKTSNNFVKYMDRHKYAYLMVAPLIIGVIIFCVYPPVYGILLAFTDKTARLNSGKFISFDNFVAIFQNPDFYDYFWIMIKIQIPRLIANILVPLIFAELVFHVNNKGIQGIYRILILLPTVAPGVVFNLVWKQIYATDGLINTIFLSLNITKEAIPFLDDIHYVIPAILLMGFPWIGGAQVLIYLSGIMGIPNEIFEAAELDGANAWQKIIKIHITSLSGQIRYFLVFGIINGLQDYGTQIVLTEGGPAGATTVPGYYMFKLMDSYGQYGKASAVGVILFVIIMILTFITYKFVNFGASKNEDY